MARLLLGHKDINVDILESSNTRILWEGEKRRRTIARLLVRHNDVGVESKHNANHELMHAASRTRNR